MVASCCFSVTSTFCAAGCVAVTTLDSSTFLLSAASILVSTIVTLSFASTSATSIFLVFSVFTLPGFSNFGSFKALNISRMFVKKDLIFLPAATKNDFVPVLVAVHAVLSFLVTTLPFLTGTAASSLTGVGAATASVVATSVVVNADFTSTISGSSGSSTLLVAITVVSLPLNASNVSFNSASSNTLSSSSVVSIFAVKIVFNSLAARPIPEIIFSFGRLSISTSPTLASPLRSILVAFSIRLQSFPSLLKYKLAFIRAIFNSLDLISSRAILLVFFIKRKAEIKIENEAQRTSAKVFILALSIAFRIFSDNSPKNHPNIGVSLLINPHTIKITQIIIAISKNMAIFLINQIHNNFNLNAKELKKLDTLFVLVVVVCSSIITPSLYSYNNVLFG